MQCVCEKGESRRGFRRVHCVGVTPGQKEFPLPMVELHHRLISVPPIAPLPPAQEGARVGGSGICYEKVKYVCMLDLASS